MSESVGAGCVVFGGWVRRPSSSGTAPGLVLADMDGEVAADAAHALEGLEGEAVSCETDVRSWASVERDRSCTETFGAIDFVVANAGIGDYSALDTGDPERWRRAIETNFLGPCTRSRRPSRDAGPGRRHIVRWRRSPGGGPGSVSRCTSRRSGGSSASDGPCARRPSSYGVRVTMIEPGMVDTPLVRSTAEGRSELERFADVRVMTSPGASRSRSPNPRASRAGAHDQARRPGALNRGRRRTSHRTRTPSGSPWMSWRPPRSSSTWRWRPRTPR